MFNTYFIALLFFHLSKLSLALDKCSQDVTIRCNFKYLSNKNCNRIGKPCTSFRQLNWVNSSVDEYSCLTNGDFTNVLSYDVDEFGLCDGVGVKSFTGKYGENCYCDTDKVVTISTSATFTATVDYTLRRQPTISPTSRPTLNPTRAPTPAPTTVPSISPTPQYPNTIPNILTYFTNYCGGSIGYENLLYGFVGTQIKKCKPEDANNLPLSPSYYILPVTYTSTQGSHPIGTFTKMYYSCNPGSTFEITNSNTGELLFTNFLCDGNKNFQNLYNFQKSVRITAGSVEFIIFD